MAKVRLKKRYRIALTTIFILICLGVFIFALMHIINWKKDVDSNHKIKEDIEKHIKADDKIDFKALKEMNNDTIAYLKVNETNIDYVVVQTKDNKYYLTHNFNKCPR